ncbi:MAG: MFS transporter [Pseudomonadota bacterium]
MLTPLAKATLLLVVFVDLIGQGLVFPIINGLVMEPASGFLPEGTSMARRHFDYGMVIGTFFLAWFFGVIYVARVSDAIGRKNAMLVCLFGALSGYAISIWAVMTNNIWLLMLGRAITGFTAGNQPIAQAAMIDGSSNDAERDRNMGLILIGVSLGLVGGPIIGGVLSDKSLIGDIASYTLPLYASLGLVALAIVMVVFFFHDIRTERQPFVFRPLDVFTSLWKITKHPVVMKLMPVYTLFMLANVTFYIFVDNYLTSRFGYGVVGGSIAMIVIGVAIAISGTFFVAPVQQRFGKRVVIGATLVVWLFAIVAFITITYGPADFLPPFFFYLIFGVSYPLFLGLFSSAVEDADQGWVMGVTTAVFCLAGGITSLMGGWLMGIDIRMPYFIAGTAAVLALLLVLATWGRPEIRAITAPPSSDREA